MRSLVRSRSWALENPSHPVREHQEQTDRTLAFFCFSTSWTPDASAEHMFNVRPVIVTKTSTRTIRVRTSRSSMAKYGYSRPDSAPSQKLKASSSRGECMPTDRCVPSAEGILRATRNEEERSQQSRYRQPLESRARKEKGLSGVLKRAAGSDVRRGSGPQREDDGVVAARQRAFVRRVVKLGLRRCPDEVASLMDQTARNGSPPFNLFMYNACITAFARSGRWREALAVLDGMRRSASAGAQGAWEAVHTHAGETLAAATTTRELWQPAIPVRPDVVSYSAAITACGNGGQRGRALALLTEMRRDGIAPNVVSYNAAAHACVISDHHGVDGSKQLGDGEGSPSDVLRLIEEMRRDGCRPDAFTLSTAITACGRAGDWERALDILEDMSTVAVESGGDPPEVGQKMVPDTVAVNAAITACGRGGQGRRALELLGRMTLEDGRRVGPLIGSGAGDAAAAGLEDQSETECSAEAPGEDRSAELSSRPDNDGDKAEAVLAAADAVSFTSAIEACSRSGRWREGLALLPKMRLAGFRPDVRTYAAYLSCLRRGGDWKSALDLLYKMEEAGGADGVSPDVGCYVVVLSSMADSGEWQRALELFRHLQRQSAAASAGALPPSAAAATEATAAEAAVGDSLLQTHASSKRRGRVDHAAAAGAVAEGPNLACCNAVLAACANGGASAPALDLLEEMGELGMWNTASFNCAMRACCGAQGEWKRAVALLGRMVTGDRGDHFSDRGESRGNGLDDKAGSAPSERQRLRRGRASSDAAVPRPDARSFAAAIAACGASGRPVEALDILRSMPNAGVQPNVVVYNAAIASYLRGANRLAWAGARHQRRRSDDEGGSDVYQVHQTASEIRECDAGTADADSSSSSSGGGGGGSRGGVGGGDCGVRPPWEMARELLGEMRSAGLTPTTESYNTVLAVCQKTGAWEGALEILQEMKGGVFSAETIANPAAAAAATAAAAAAAAAAVADDSALFQPPTPDIISFNTAIAACGKAKRWREALSLLDEASSSAAGGDWSPDEISYNTAAAACARAEKWKLALEVVERGRRAGVMDRESGTKTSRGGHGASLSVTATTAPAGARRGFGRKKIDASRFHATLEAMVKKEDRQALATGT